MTDLSALGSGGGGNKPYPSGVPLIGPIPNNLATGLIAGHDYLLPFVPRADVTVDKLWWYRYSATAASIYMGLVDSSGNRLDDCAVDSDTTVGIHEVDTTNFDLTAGTWYGVIINPSASSVASGDQMGSTDQDLSAQIAYNYAHPMDIGLFASGTFPSSGRTLMTARKSRTAAAVADPTTMTGWAGNIGFIPFIGIVPA
jgi:hypothetical protein